MTKNERFLEARKLYDNRQYDKAVPLFQALADDDDTGGQLYLGICYEKGEGVPQDYAKAAYWYDKASDFNADAGTALKRLKSEGKI